MRKPISTAERCQRPLRIGSTKASDSASKASKKGRAAHDDARPHVPARERHALEPRDQRRAGVLRPDGRRGAVSGGNVLHHPSLLPSDEACAEETPHPPVANATGPSLSPLRAERGNNNPLRPLLPV